MKIVFFGSTSDSVLVLQKLSDVVAVVTQPPKPVGRKQTITPTPVEQWAKSHNIPVTTLTAVTPFKPDLLVSASYGEKIPAELITMAKFGGLNVHPSLLPRWRGGDPVPWAIISGDHQIGVTVVTLSEQFDRGKIIAQQKIPITDHDTSGPLRTKLFGLGAELILESLPDYLSGKNKGTPQKTEDQPYAKRFTREDGFEPWEKIINPGEEERLNRKFRALHPWPGLWTRFRENRLKILGFDHTPTLVQLEGKTPISWEQFKTAYFTS
jgi:methionyl-tRNA formyltransferase